MRAVSTGNQFNFYKPLILFGFIFYQKVDVRISFSYHTFNLWNVSLFAPSHEGFPSNKWGDKGEP